MVEPFDSAIAAGVAEFNRLKSEMESIRIAFVQQSARFLRDWYPRGAQEVAKNEPEVTMTLDDAALAVIKAEVGCSRARRTAE